MRAPVSINDVNQPKSACQHHSGHPFLAIPQEKYHAGQWEPSARKGAFLEPEPNYRSPGEHQRLKLWVP